MAEKKPLPPPGLGREATGLWRELVGRYEFDPHELALLREIVRVVDRCEALAAAVQVDGVLDSSGRAHPALIEARQQQTVLAKLVTGLRLPNDESGEVGSAISDAARNAADKRWRGARRGA